MTMTLFTPHKLAVMARVAEVVSKVLTSLWFDKIHHEMLCGHGSL